MKPEDKTDFVLLNLYFRLDCDKVWNKVWDRCL